MSSVLYAPTRHRLLLSRTAYKTFARVQIACPVLTREYHCFNTYQFKQNILPAVQLKKRSVSSSAKMGAETNNEQFKLENLFNVRGKGTSLFPLPSSMPQTNVLDSRTCYRRRLRHRPNGRAIPRRQRRKSVHRRAHRRETPACR